MKVVREEWCSKMLRLLSLAVSVEAKLTTTC